VIRKQTGQQTNNPVTPITHTEIKQQTEEKAMQVIEKDAHGTKAWHWKRHRDEYGHCLFGASDIPALMGASSYKTRGELFADKCNDPVVTEETAVFRRGNLFEKPLLEEASRVLGINIFTPDVIYREGRLSISLDGVDHEQNPTIVVEAKTTTRYSIYSSDDLPAEWRWQGWAQMAVLKVPVWFVVLDRDLRISVVELPENPEAINALLLETAVFGGWVDGDPMDEDINNFSAADIARIWKAEPTTVELPASAVDWALQLEEARAMAKQAADLEAKAKDALAQMMLGNEIGTVDGVQVVSWKQQAGKASLDTKQLRADHPELVSQYEKQGAPFRVMRVTRGKSK
jgi:predicted phage-related endonuclease